MPLEIGRAIGPVTARGADRLLMWASFGDRASRHPMGQRASRRSDSQAGACSQWRDRAGLPPASSAPARTRNIAPSSIRTQGTRAEAANHTELPGREASIRSSATTRIWPTWDHVAITGKLRHPALGRLISPAAAQLGAQAAPDQDAGDQFDDRQTEAGQGQPQPGDAP